MPRFSDLFNLLVQMGTAPDVHFLTYPIMHRYADMEEALIDARGMFGQGWDESAGRAALQELLRPDDGELVFDGGLALTGVAHWRPPES